jgi:hypothetical protein
MATSSEVTKMLAEPFDPFDIEWRVQSAGRSKGGNKPWAIIIPYITNRAIQERLDQVCGADGWYNRFEHPTDRAVTCGISIRFKQGEVFEWITKWDGAQETDIEAVKGGLSSAMKRAAVQWGIGRYLYRLEAVVVTPLEAKPAQSADYIMTVAKLEGKKTRIWFKRPNLPKWALQDSDDAEA